jgi:predicted dehydrogenase
VLRVAIIGCGKIADEHAQHISRIQNCKLVGLCDAELLMAKQMHDRFNRVDYFDNVDDLLSRVQPDVVHITTPPQSHFALTRHCLEAGCHVYVEKPFTLNAQEAVGLVTFATERGLKATVGHNLLFSDPAIRMRNLVRRGFLGDAPVHLESYYCYNLGDAAYAKAFLGDSQHWLRRLPGGLFQNIISHGISRIAEYFTSDSPTVIAHAFTSGFLRELGERQIQDELRVIVSDESTTAYFTFSTQMRPQLSQMRVYGNRNGLVLDDLQHTLIKLKGSKYKSYLENFIPPAALGSAYLRNAASNLQKFVTGQLNMTAGMRALIERFYRSITHDDPLPIPYREIILTARIMDAIFTQTSRLSSAAASKAAVTV